MKKLLIFISLLFSSIDLPNKHGVFVLIGGGYCIDGIQWAINKAPNKNLLILSTEYSSWSIPSELYKLVDIEILVMPTYESANLQKNIEKIKQAGLILISGGNQDEYIDLWKHSRALSALKKRVGHIPICGTSAGLAILGEYYYTGINGSITTNTALKNPYDIRMNDIGYNFLNIPLLKNIITDSHYTERNRMGRHISFMARVMKDYKVKNITGIGLDEQTALCIDSFGFCKVVGEGDCYFLYGKDMPEICEPGKSLTWNRVYVYKLIKNKLYIRNYINYFANFYKVSVHKNELKVVF